MVEFQKKVSKSFVCNSKYQKHQYKTPLKLNYNLNDDDLVQAEVEPDSTKAQIISVNNEIHATIDDIGNKIQTTIKKKEDEYLQIQNVFIKRKEKELNQVLENLQGRNESKLKEKDKFAEMTLQINAQSKAIRYSEQQRLKQEEIIVKQRRDLDDLQQENKFYKKNLAESKRQNQILKLALSRLQNQSELTPFKASPSVDIDDRSPFITQNRRDYSPAYVEQKTLDKLRESTQTISTLGENTSKKSLQLKRLNAPTVNLKFEYFLDRLFGQGMPKKLNDVKDQIVKYVQVIETHYTEVITEFKKVSEKERIRSRKVQADCQMTIAENNDLESLFKEAVEEVKKQIMKRKFKNDLQKQKKIPSDQPRNISPRSEDKDFENSLIKLTKLGQKKVKFNDFTAIDKFNMLDLFVSNQSVLLSMYDTLFGSSNNHTRKVGLANASIIEAMSLGQLQSPTDYLPKNKMFGRRQKSESQSFQNIRLPLRAIWDKSSDYIPRPSGTIESEMLAKQITASNSKLLEKFDFLDDNSYENQKLWLPEIQK